MTVIEGNTVEDKVLYIVEAFPASLDNYNELVRQYWKHHDGVTFISDIPNATAAESITRALRKLVVKGKVKLPEETRNRRVRAETEFRDKYSRKGDAHGR